MFSEINWFSVQLYSRHQGQQALYYATVHNVVSGSFEFDAHGRRKSLRIFFPVNSLGL